MKNLKIWQKLTLTGLILMIPFAAVTYKMASSINILGVEFARQEIRGLEYYTAASALLTDLQQHRAFATGLINGVESLKEPFYSKSAEIEADIQKLEEVDKRLEASLHLRSKWIALSAECRELLKRPPGQSPPQEAYGKAIAETIALIAQASDASNLTLDPDIDSYYLMNILINQAPELSELLSQAYLAGSSISSGKTGTAEQLAAVDRLLTLTEFLQAKLHQSLGKALGFNSAITSQLEAPASASANSVQGAIRSIRNLASNRAAESGDSISAANQSSQLISDLEHRCASVLQNLLETRAAKFQREVFQTLFWAVLGLLVVWAIGFFIIRGITRSLSQIVKTANQIATGDLAVQTDLGAHHDEIGILARAFEQMVSSLKESAGVAERIAAGDLAVTIKPQSQHDVMGNALLNMVSNLSALVGRVHESSLQIGSAVVDIAATSREQQATASQIAATTTEIGATSKEISSTSMELVRTMHEVSEVAEEAATLAGSGQVGLTRMETTMRRVVEAAGSISGKLAVLSEKASNIGQVVTAITKVADQTNMLSLNAAIEAEKAGEAGRGFAVVATEIRRLADQTAVATYDIEEMVKQIQSAIAAGVMGMDKFSEEVRGGMQEVQQVGGQLSQIIHQVQALAPRVEFVNEGMQAQSTGAQQISEALGQLTEAAQQTVESLTQSNQAINDLKQVASGLGSGVARFKLNRKTTPSFAVAANEYSAV
ncbi:MAG: methyl-accepting chemotaxis protein [Chthoniobacteraceae bacterium]|nr:methyl-accepting chemotaxis protein [Chthoniobacteraceae bacterium]